MEERTKLRIAVALWLIVAVAFFWCLHRYTQAPESEKLWIEVVSDKELHEIELE